MDPQTYRIKCHHFFFLVLSNEKLVLTINTLISDNGADNCWEIIDIWLAQNAQQIIYTKVGKITENIYNNLRKCL